jgi:hypothetical protein
MGMKTSTKATERASTGTKKSPRARAVPSYAQVSKTSSSYRPLESGHTTVARIYDLPGFSVHCGDPTVTADTTKLSSHLSSLLTSSEFLYLADTYTPHLSSIFASVTPNCQPQLSSPTPTHGVLTSSSHTLCLSFGLVDYPRTP